MYLDSKLYDMLRREKSAGYMTNWAARLFARRIERSLKPLGLSPAYLPVFFALADGEALSQKELTRRAAVEQPTMAATLARMQRDGLLERRADPRDRRGALYSLRPKAMPAVEKVAAAVAATNAEVLAGLAEAERPLYLDLLGRIVGHLVELEAREAPAGQSGP